MATTIDEITTVNWQISAYRFGAVVEGGDDINQSIVLVIGTRKGSDPFRPSFGSDLWDHIDKPINIAPALIIRSIRDAITLWVPQIKLENIEYTFQDSFGDENGLPSGMRFNIFWSPEFSGNRQELSLLVTTQSTEEIPVQTLIRILATESGEGLTTAAGQMIQII